MANELCWDGQYHDWRTNHLIDPLPEDRPGRIWTISWYCTRCRCVEMTDNPPAPSKRPLRTQVSRG